MKFLALLVTIIASMAVAVTGASSASALRASDESTTAQQNSPESHEEVLRKLNHPQHRSRRMEIENGRRIQFEDSVLRCSNTPWSPCGPGSACEDTDTGYICENLMVHGCFPVGCSRNSQCVKGDNGIHACICDEGYARPDEWMPCTPIADVVN